MSFGTLPLAPARAQSIRARDSRGRIRLAATAAVLALCGVSACAGPYGRARTIGAVGGALAAVGGASWVVGETTDTEPLLVPGVVAVVLGSAAMLTSAVMVAAQTSCTADADCPMGYLCKELLQPAGRESFSQCVPR